MIGAIIGDIAGSRFEFNNTSDYDFEMFTPACGFTDDTICTVGVADAILRKETYMDSVHRWCRRYPNPMGAYGSSFARWVRSGNPQPYGSFGNGAAMRVAPIAWAFDDEAEVVREAEASAAISHNHPEGLKGAAAVALGILRLRQQSAQVEEIADGVMNAYYGADWEKHLVPEGLFDVTCQGCVPLAFHILKCATDFEDAVRKAVAYGGDSDTLGAIVGSLAEGRWRIPAAIVEKALTYLPDEMKNVVKQFGETFR